jgi:3-phenylpropionate/cinnamic acid dioxygenase small subunit
MPARRHVESKTMAAGQQENPAVQDDAAIRNLIARIAHIADTGAVDDYVHCFTADARWELPGAPRCGRADIRAGSQARRDSGEIGPGSATRHVVGTTVVDIDGDGARATSYFQFFVQTSTTPQLRLLGQYDDDFVRCRDGWLLAHRRITLG